MQKSTVAGRPGFIRSGKDCSTFSDIRHTCYYE